MGLHKALGDHQISLGDQLVQPQLAAGGQCAHQDEVFVLVCVVDDQLLPVTDGVAVLGALFRLRGITVHAGGDEDGDVRLGIGSPDLLQVDRQRDGAGQGAGVIAGDDDHLVLAFGQLAQWRGADRMRQRRAHQLLLIRQLMLGMGGSQHRAQTALRDVQRLPGLSVGNLDPHFTFLLGLMIRIHDAKKGRLGTHGYRSSLPYDRTGLHSISFQVNQAAAG